MGNPIQSCLFQQKMSAMAPSFISSVFLMIFMMKYLIFYWIRICYTVDTDDKEGTVQSSLTRRLTVLPVLKILCSSF